MSHPSRPQARGSALRRRREVKLETIVPLEERSLLTPVLTISPTIAAIAPTTTGNTATGTAWVTQGTPDTGFLTAAPFTTVSELTPVSSFGGDIVTIAAGPGADFGSGVYAISRGAGANGVSAANTPVGQTPRTVSSAINRPGVIYRVDPATGKTSVFFDLNTVVSQLETGATAANSVGASTGLVNWYSITFDPEGYFDGKPSMFVSSVDRSDPNKNVVYRIAPDGTFMGAFVEFTDGASALKFNINPSAVLVMPPQSQTFLHGLIAGSGTTSNGGTFAALLFSQNGYSPGTPINSGTLPTGVTQTGFTLGNITGLTAANPNYNSAAYSTFTDFGTPAAGGIPATLGNSGVQGLNGELLINGGITPALAQTSPDSTITDRLPVATSNLRQFESIAFDQYGFFSQGANISTAVATTGATGSPGSVGVGLAGGGAGSGVGTVGIAGTNTNPIVLTNTYQSITLPPANAGSLFVGDLSTGLSLPVAVPNSTTGQVVRVPVLGPETVTVVANANGTVSTTITPTGPGLGGRIVRITSTGVVSSFAQGFHTWSSTDSSGFQMSSLSISFSADGTTLYASDNDAIWQFKTVASLASSTSGSLTGLNDLRSLGVPYDGQGSAVAIIDSGVDASSTPFRGRVANGTNIFTNGFGNSDTSVFGTPTATGAAGGGGGAAGGGGGAAGGGGAGGAAGGATGGNTGIATTYDGHGTPVAGVVAQFVPQATIVPVNIFAPFLLPQNNGNNLGGAGGAGGAGGGLGGGAGGIGVTAQSNALTSSQDVYQGLAYVAAHPFVSDPIRQNVVDRVIAATMAFGTTETFNSERGAYKRYPQITIALKNQLKKFRALGIAPIAATGQFGQPYGAGLATAAGGAGGAGGGGGLGGGGGGLGGGAGGVILNGNNSAGNPSVGDAFGVSLPAVLNEVISVGGVYPFPYVGQAGSPPTDQPIGIIPRPIGPIMVFGNLFVIGGTAVPGGGGAAGGAGGGGGNAGGGNNGGANAGIANGGNPAGDGNLSVLAAADYAIYANRIVGATNRNTTTDYVAPAIDVPTFRRTFTVPTIINNGVTTVATASVNGDPTDHNTFTQAGTSMSSAIVTGAFSLVSSALQYWSSLEQTGVTSSAYLAQPVGVNSLNFGPHAFKDMTIFNNPDGINSILQWTAVPAANANDGLSVSTPKQLIGSTSPPNYSSVNVGNAIAAIEGEIAIQYLLAHNDFQYIDTNNNGLITAQEIQNFVDNANTMGMPEAGAMARLLGGTATTPTNLAPMGTTLFGETPDQGNVLQRRFNFIDYAANGSLRGSVTIDQLKMLSTTLLPSPTAFVINDRQRASVNHYLVAPTAQRNYANLQHLLPRYEFIPQSALVKYRNISPAQFHVNRGVTPGLNVFPVYTLYSGPTNKSGQEIITNSSTSGGSSTGGSGAVATSSALRATVTPATPVVMTTSNKVAVSTTVTPAVTTPASSTTTTAGTASSSTAAGMSNPATAAIVNAIAALASPSAAAVSSTPSTTSATTTTTTPATTTTKMPVTTTTTTAKTPKGVLAAATSPLLTTANTAATTATQPPAASAKAVVAQAKPKSKNFLQKIFGI